MSPEIIAVVFLAIIGLFIYLKSAKIKTPPGPQKNIDHGSAEWASQEQIEAAGFNYNEDGLWIGDGLCYPKNGHLITIASSGQGKGTCVIIPNLLTNPRGKSFVVTDPKGELACITARAQKQYGQRVIILDPWDEQAKINSIHGIAPSGFNPFDFLKMDMDELLDNCEQIAYFLAPDRPGDKDPYWNDRARSMMKIFLLHIITSQPNESQNFWTLYKMLRFSGEDWIKLLLEMQENMALDGLISAASGDYLGFDADSKTLASIKSSAQNATTIFESPQLRKSLEKSEFNPYNLTHGNHTVYVVIPERFLDTHSTWLRLVIGLCLRACNARPRERVCFLLDEFATMGKMKDIQRGYAFSRGQNIMLWVFAQSLSQIKEIYGEDGMHTFIGNSAVLQCFGVKDQYTKQYISTELGEATRQKEEKSYSSSKEGASSSTSFSTYARPLLTPEEVGKTPYMVIISERIKYTLPKIPYHFNRYEGLDLKNDPHVPESLKKEYVDKGLLIPDHREIFEGLADPPPRVII